MTSADVVLSYCRRFYDAHQYTNTGPLSRALEERLAALHGAAYCKVFSSSFWALALAVRALALPGRSEVIVPSLADRRVADVAAWCQLKPRWCDVDADTLALSAAAVEPRVSHETALVLACHPISGWAQAGELETLAERSGVPLLFDSVTSSGETLEGRRIGTFGNAECFSLGAGSLVDGFKGGYLTTDDGALSTEVSLTRGFGFNGHDNVEHLGFNAKLNELHAAMALASLDDLDTRIARSRERRGAYEAMLRAIPGVRLRGREEGGREAPPGVIVELTEAWPSGTEETLEILRAGSVDARRYCPADLPALADRTAGSSSRSRAARLADRLVVLPSGDEVSLEDIGRTCALLGHIEATTARPGEGWPR